MILKVQSLVYTNPKSTTQTVMKDSENPTLEPKAPCINHFDSSRTKLGSAILKIVKWKTKWPSVEKQLRFMNNEVGHASLFWLVGQPSMDNSVYSVTSYSTPWAKLLLVGFSRFNMRPRFLSALSKRRQQYYIKTSEISFSLTTTRTRSWQNAIHKYFRYNSWLEKHSYSLNSERMHPFDSSRH